MQQFFAFGGDLWRPEALVFMVLNLAAIARPQVRTARTADISTGRFFADFRSPND